MNRLSLIIRQKVFGIIFIVAALLGGVLIYWYISNLKSESPDSFEYQEIYIARFDIESGEEISEDFLEKQKIPENIFSKKFILDKNQILGKKVIENIAEGEIISKDKIEGQELIENTYLSFSTYIPRDLRAVSIPLNFYGDRSLIKVGDRVDIISTYYDQTGSELISNTILCGKEIILLEYNYSEDGYPGENNSGGDFLLGTMLEDDYSSSSYMGFLILTFYLKSEEAEEVFLALERGMLNLSICSQSKTIKY